MQYMETIKQAFRASAFNEQSIVQLSDDERGTGFGFLTLAIAGIITALMVLVVSAASNSPPMALAGAAGVIAYPAVIIAGFIICYSIYHCLAKFLCKGKASGAQYFRALSALFVIYWCAVPLMFLPYLGTVAEYGVWVWLAALNIFVLMKVHKLDAIKAILLGLLPMLIIAVLVFALGLHEFSRL